MRYGPDHKERTRKQIVSIAANLFRRDGLVATGVVGLMKEAGLTQGGFYAHFESKEALIREAVVTAIGQTYEGLRRIGEAAGQGPAGLKAIIEAYLSTRHAQGAELGCAMAAVGAELSREPTATREAFTAASNQLVTLIASHLPADCEDKVRLARSVFGLMSGTIQLARLSTDPDETLEILEGGRVAALSLCGIPAGERSTPVAMPSSSRN